MIENCIMAHCRSSVSLHLYVKGFVIRRYIFSRFFIGCEEVTAFAHFQSKFRITFEQTFSNTSEIRNDTG
ncbi:hypothetical protein E2C01_026280 [Portunus trituberculatus]|uniref:Uncharacterized protein n=1 Tax=Portunus trituberculatus TaxID=210409 RepID=A0A5B7EKA2_PORTR|nr:hypothetical protein [Portunus trituberculatus]